MARCSKKTVGGGGCQTCNDTQAKGPAAILSFEAKKKQSEARAGRQGGKAKAEARQTTTKPEHNQEKQRQEKGEGNGRKKQKERDNQEGRKRGTKETKRRRNNTKTKENPPGEGPTNPRTNRPHAQPPSHPPPDPQKAAPAGRAYAQASGPTSPRGCAQGISRQQPKQLKAVKTCVHEGHLLHPKNKRS